MAGDPTFTQSSQLLELVWDALLHEPAGGPYRTVGEMLLAGAEVADISHVIDVAITTYVEHMEGEGGDLGTRTESP